MFVDYVHLALCSSKRAFTSAMPYYFLVCDGALERPARPVRTAPFEKTDFGTTMNGLGDPEARQINQREFMVLAIRKMNETFPTMITLGRTANNDLVVPDVSVSKFHAFFRVLPTRLELGDAGSKNGTFIATRELVPRGDTEVVKLGEKVRFGRVSFDVLDAGGCWDAIERKRRIGA
jgi:hypothetical protein